MSPIDDSARDLVSSLPTTDAESPVPYSTTQPEVRLTRSYEAFVRDLPELLAAHAGQWVAYAGSERLGIDTSKRALYRRCIALGRRDGEFLICGIEQPQRIVLDDLLDV